MTLTEEQKAQEMAQLQTMIRDFVKEVLQGVVLDVVLEDGSLLPCKCTMDNRLTIISLQVREIIRHIRLIDVQEICSGKELQNIHTTTPLDDFCVTFAMSNDQCVTFKFKNVAAREHFSTCMKVLRLAVE